MEPSTSAVIVSVGDELLYGETIDTNAAWLGRYLGDRGIRVIRRSTVGDADAEIQAAVSAAIDVGRLVIVTGGLGPTPDDRTKSAVCDLLGLSMTVDSGVQAALERRFASSGHQEIPPLSRGQAEVPVGARVLRNPRGTASGLLLEHGEATIVLLPGVPRELYGIADGDLGAALSGLVGGKAERLHHRVIHTTGIAESRLAELIEAERAGAPERGGAVSLAYLPDLLGVDLRLTVSAASPEEADALFRPLEELLEPVVGPWRFDAAGGDVAEAISNRLRAAGRTLAVAESCTGGLVAKRMTDLSGSSDVFLGGVIAYANGVKIEHLGVTDEDLERHGAVSEAVARQMATGVAERFGSDAGIGVTGVAGPGGGTEDKPVGTVWIGVAVGGTTESTRHRFAGDRAAIRERAAQEALAQLYRRLGRASAEA